MKSGVSVVTAVVQGIANGNEELSSRIEQQAASLQQAASSMEEMTTTVRQNSNNAQEARRLADNNTIHVTQTGDLMAQLVDNMQRITQSSQKMADIIDVIDSIAFQTNILALNVSVEAARAGEHGRGFAEVHQAVTEMDRATQQNTARVQETARAAAVLEQQAGSRALLVEANSQGALQPSMAPHATPIAAPSSAAQSNNAILPASPVKRPVASIEEWEEF